MKLGNTYETNKLNRREDFDVGSFNISHTEREETGVRLFGVEHPEQKHITKVNIVELNPEMDISNILAWLGARTSRSKDSYTELLKGIVSIVRNNPRFAAKKIQEVFGSYGHESVADMAHLALFIEQIPIIDAMEIFYSLTVVDGQETSTRYIDFSNFNLPDISLGIQFQDKSKEAKFIGMYQAYSQKLLHLYTKWNRISQDIYTSKFKYEKTWSDEDKKLQSTLFARSFDIARNFIPCGAATNQTLVINARNLIELTVRLRESDSASAIRIGEQLLVAMKLNEHKDSSNIQLFAGEFAKYTKPLQLHATKLQEIYKQIPILQSQMSKSDFLRCSPESNNEVCVERDNEKQTAINYLRLVFPKEFNLISNDAYTIQDTTFTKLSSIITESQGKQEKLYNPADTRGLAVTVKTNITSIRDLARHRAFGVFVPNLFGSMNPEYVVQDSKHQGSNIQIHTDPAFERVREVWNRDWQFLCKELLELFECSKEGELLDPALFQKLLPLGWETLFTLSGPFNQWNYMTSLRTRGGGDINYIMLVQSMLEKIRASHPLYSHLAPQAVPFDQNNFEQWRDRS
jgi:thymidylate synthase ThyX